MNSDNLLQLLQTGLRVSLGATTSLVETFANPEKREENLAQLKLELSQRVTEWEEKGLITEQEARSFIETILKQQNNSTGSSTTETATDNVAEPPTTAASPTMQREVEALTSQLAAIRAELEKLRNSDSTS